MRTTNPLLIYCDRCLVAEMADFTAMEKSGWFLNTSAVEEFCPGMKNADELSKALLDVDLRHVGRSRQADLIVKAKSDMVEGPIVLQIQKLRNVCIPKEAEDSSAGGGGGPRLLKYVLTDGQQTMNAIELESLPGFSLNVPPGSKLKLIGRVSVCSGYLLLSRNNCKLLGGNVQNLVDGWTLKRSLASHYRDSNRVNVGPPPFIPFGERGKLGSRATQSRAEGFKSLDGGAKKKEVDSEFEQQRKAVIEAALQEQQNQGNKAALTKQQQQDRDVATIVDMGFNAKDAATALHGSGGDLQRALNSLIGGDKTTTDGTTTNGRTNDSFHGSSEPRNSGMGRNMGDARGNKGDSRSSGVGSRSDGSRSEGPQRERGERGGRRGGRRGQEREEEGYCRPSAPATLFDFVTTKMTLPSQGEESNSKSRNSPPVQLESSKKDDGAVPVESITTISKAPARSANPPQQPTPTSQQHVQLPPRLQRKQRQVEEEKFMKYYKPMEYMRQSNFSHGSNAGNAPPSAAAASSKSNSASAGSRPVHDIHSRGTVKNRTLWTDSNEGDTVSKMDQPKAEKGAATDATSDTRRSHEERPSARSRDSNDVRSSGKSHESNSRPGRGPGERSVKWADGEGQPSSNSDRYGVVGELEKTMTSMSVSTGLIEDTGLQRSVLRQGSQQQSTRNGGRQWKIGDECMAKYWQDKQYYKAQIKAVGEQSLTVLFTDYGNTEKVSRGDVSELTNNNAAWYGAPDAGVSMTATYQVPTSSVPYQSSSGPGHNVVYQPVAAASLGAPSAQHSIYYTSPYSNTVFDPTTGQSVLVQATPPVQQPSGSSGVPGILIQGPPPQVYQPSHRYMSNEASVGADNRTGVTQQQFVARK